MKKIYTLSIQNKGMTLAEVLVTMGIMVAVLLVVATFQYDVITYPKTISGSFVTVQDTQILLKTMLKELRGMRSGANGAYALITSGTSTVSFFSDSENDGTVDLITYSLVGPTMYRGVISPTGNPETNYDIANQVTRMLVTNVRNGSSTPIFQYFDTNYNGTSSPLTQPVTATAVRLIKINLMLDVDINRSPTPATYTVQASLRNLKSNL